MIENIINSIIEGVSFMLIGVGIPAGTMLLFTKWAHSDSKGGSKNGK